MRQNQIDLEALRQALQYADDLSQNYGDPNLYKLLETNESVQSLLGFINTEDTETNRNMNIISTFMDIFQAGRRYAELTAGASTKTTERTTPPEGGGTVVPISAGRRIRQFVPAAVAMLAAIAFTLLCAGLQAWRVFASLLALACFGSPLWKLAEAHARKVQPKAQRVTT